MNKKILVIPIILLFLCGVFVTVKGESPHIVDSYTVGHENNYIQSAQATGEQSICGVAQGFRGDGTYLDQGQFYILKSSGTAITGSLTGYIYYTDQTTVLAKSNVVDASLITTSYSLVIFQFNDTLQLNNGVTYYFVVDVRDISPANNIRFATNSSAGSPNLGTFSISYGTFSGQGNSKLIFYIYGFNNYGGATPTPTPTVTPTPAPPSGSVGVNYFVNNSQNYNQYGNITWALFSDGTTTLNYFVGNMGATLWLLDGAVIGLKPQLANGWYFRNYSITNSDGTVSILTDRQALILNSTKGIWNITMGIEQTPNTVEITFVDVVHGSIYWRNYVDSVPYGVSYGAGVYNTQVATVMYVSTIPDSGYKTDYFTVYTNGVNSKVIGENITIIAMANSTITPHYYIYSSTNVNEGLSSLWGFLGGFTWQNILALIIYIICCSVCTYLFAFTGLIAGLDIATLICFLIGLLGNLMYPVLGLVIVANIALIIVGSGLLNRRKDGKDA